MAEAVREKAIKAIKALKSRLVSVILSAKKSGRKMKKFLMYWWGRMSFIRSLTFNTKSSYFY
jgi:hypothetical protein